MFEPVFIWRMGEGESFFADKAVFTSLLKINRPWMARGAVDTEVTTF